MSETYTNNVGRSDYRLPTVNANDNGKILKVVEGEWKKAEGGGGPSLPAVTSDDNGDVLTVVEGAWGKAAPSGGGGLTLYGPYMGYSSTGIQIEAGGLESLEIDTIEDLAGDHSYTLSDVSETTAFIIVGFSNNNCLIDSWTTPPMESVIYVNGFNAANDAALFNVSVYFYTTNPLTIITNP